MAALNSRQFDPLAENPHMRGLQHENHAPGVKKSTPKGLGRTPAGKTLAAPATRSFGKDLTNAMSRNNPKTAHFELSKKINTVASATAGFSSKKTMVDRARKFDGEIEVAHVNRFLQPYRDEYVETAVASIARVVAGPLLPYKEIALPESEEEEIEFAVIEEEEFLGDTLDKLWMPGSQFELDFSLPSGSPFSSDSESC